MAENSNVGAAKQEGAGEEGGKIDKSLYDRQLFVFGMEAMVSLSKMKVLICGLGGLGVEVAKNLILAGPKSVTLWDPTPTSYADLASQYYLGEDSVGKGRAEVSVKQLGELNGYVHVEHYAGELDDAYLKRFQVICFANVEDLALLDRVAAFAHANQIAFINAESRGLFGSVFVDFGDNFVVKDVDGEQRESYVITAVDNEKGHVRILLAEGTRVEFDTGAIVQVRELKGGDESGKKNLAELNGKEFKVTRVGPAVVDLEEVKRDEYGAYATGGVLQEVKKPKQISFGAWADALKEPLKHSNEWSMPDWGKFDHPGQLHLGFQALRAFRQEKGRYPKPGDEEDGADVLGRVKALNEAAKKAEGFSVDEVSESLIQTLSHTSSGEINPLAAYLGGIVAQECVKATGKFHPIHQFYYFDAIECLPKDFDFKAECAGGDEKSRYVGQTRVLGKSLQEKLKNLKVFLVGAGALGCELLKNFACMGLGTGGAGYIQVTDLDSIEKSNLNRQFLFRPPDIGGMKSVCAAKAVQKMNPSLNVTAHETPVGKDTEDTFNDLFWEDLDLVVNGLDNIQARLYVDERCVQFKKPLLESGTLGTKANTQVVLPSLTQNYGASKDPPEKQIAVCTEKHFPYKIEHTIQWAKTLFLKMFTEIPTDVNNYLDDAKYIEHMLENNPSANVRRDKLSAIQEHLKRLQAGVTFEECIRDARLLFEEQFSNLLKQLLFNFPVDAKTRDGAPFWSPPKRPPIPAEFDVKNEVHLNFVMATAHLLATLYRVQEGVSHDAAFFEKVLAGVDVPEFKPKQGVKIKEKDDDDVDEGAQDDESAVEALLKSIPKPDSIEGKRLEPQEFEKDVDSNHHIDFIAAAANLRAANYEITQVTRHQVKGIAGKIIPAVATTTSMITGLVCLELYKTIQQMPLERFRNAYVNLAIPVAAFSEPLAPEKHVSKEGEVRAVPEGWSVWDTIDLDGDITIQGVLDHFMEKDNAEVGAIAAGNFQLYQPFFASHKERLPRKVTDVWMEVNKVTELPKGKSYIELVVIADDADNDDIEVDLPIVRVYYNRK